MCNTPHAGAASAEHAERLQHLRHELGNVLYSMSLHIRCAETSVEDGELDTVRYNLARIESAVGDTRRIIDEVLAASTPPKQQE